MTDTDRVVYADGSIEINAGRRTVRLTVRNTGDRAVQVGSHFHFFEANRALSFDREKAYGMHLDIPAGTAVRIEVLPDGDNLSAVNQHLSVFDIASGDRLDQTALNQNHGVSSPFVYAETHLCRFRKIMV